MRRALRSAVLALLILVTISPACERGEVTPTPVATPVAPPSLGASPTAAMPATATPLAAIPSPTPSEALAVGLGFDTIGQGYYEGPQYRAFPVGKPQLIVLQDPRDLDLLVFRGAGSSGRDLYLVSEETFHALSEIDFGRYFVLAAFFGDSYETESTITIKEMAPGENRDINLRALIVRGGPVRGKPTPTAADYHAVRVSRSPFAEGTEYNFVLLNQEGYEQCRAKGIVNEIPGQSPRPMRFESVEFGGSGSTRRHRSRETQLHVFSDLESALSFVNGEMVWAGGREPGRALLEVDYQEYFAVIAFLGSQVNTGRSLRVVKVNERGPVVQLIALFTDPSGVLTGPSDPYEIIRVHKSDLEVKGEINLILLDHLGLQRATAAATID